MKSIAFFNHSGGSGKSVIVYHLAWMFADRGTRVLVIDLDPQAHLTALCLTEDRLEELWPEGAAPLSVYGAIHPVLHCSGTIAPPHVETLQFNLGLIPGDLGLSRCEEEFAAAWQIYHQQDASGFRLMTVFHQLVQAGSDWGADIVLMDLGPNLGALNRAAHLAADQVVLALSPDLISWHGLKPIGHTLRKWQSDWDQILAQTSTPLNLPSGRMLPAGYVVSEHDGQCNRKATSVKQWLHRLPREFHAAILDEEGEQPITLANDPCCLAVLKSVRTLMPLAREARKPMFVLKPDDGAIGAHEEAVRACYDEFWQLAKRVGDLACLVVN